MLYACFLFWSETIGDKADRNIYSLVHKSNIADQKNIDGFILGGSNARWGLSAAIMANTLDQKWYNLSLTSEGSTDTEYWNFIKSSTSDKSRLEAQTVVYSSSTILRENIILQRSSYFFKMISSTDSFFIPSKSIASYLKNYFIGDKEIFISKLGDKVFELSECRSGELSISINNKETNKKQIKVWVLSQLKILNSLFPRAEIVFVIPSELYSNIDLKRSKENTEAINEGISIFRSNNDVIVTLIDQPSYPSINILCNDGLHANPSGREWRTNNLIDSYLTRLEEE